MKHSIVYAEQGIYAGWPANHGAWQWGNEFLVGFLRGKYKITSMHNIEEPFEKVFARSLDGGETWKLERPKTIDGFDCLSPTVPPPFYLMDRDTIIRCCGVYDHGGDECNEEGGFYLSRDRGHNWEGPYQFVGDMLHWYAGGTDINTSRTRVLGNLVFLSKGLSQMWGQDSTFCAIHNGEEFIHRGDVCGDDARAVMPAVAFCNFGGRIVATLRRRKSGKRNGWIDSVYSDDGGRTWSQPMFVADTGGRNGNPPALISSLDDRLICAYGNRDEGSMCYSISLNGMHWTSSELIRKGNDDSYGGYLDIGYPQLFMRNDGVPVCVYYWTEPDRLHQHIVATAMEELA